MRWNIVITISIIIHDPAPPAKQHKVEARQEGDDGANDRPDRTEERSRSPSLIGVVGQHDPAVGVGEVGDRPNEEPQCGGG